MSKNNDSPSFNGYDGLPRSMYTRKTRSVVKERVPKSNSAMSTRTYSRMKESVPTKLGDGDVRRNMEFEEDESTQMNESYTDLQELQNEKELLGRMLDQQRQLQELKERQKRVLLLQRQLADMEASAEVSVEQKLDKLQTAKKRLDELQKLVSTIKSAEAADKDGGGDQSSENFPDKANRVRKALQELNELKDLIGMMSSGNEASYGDAKKPAATLEPVFPNSIEGANNFDDRSESSYRPVLPEVSVVQFDDDKGSPQRSPRKSPKRKSKDLGNRAQKQFVPYRLPHQTPTPESKNKLKTPKSSSKETEDVEATFRLLEEMKRHQELLEELKDRRRELEILMNMTNTSAAGQDQQDEADEDIEDDYDDATASNKSDVGSNDDSVTMPEAEVSEFEMTQSGRLFGLSDVNTRRLIDLMRNQKALGTLTEKTTATWGSSSSEGSDDEEDKPSNSRRQIESDVASKAIGNAQNNSTMETTVKDAFTQMNYNKEHEIDFRPPTRRRRNLTHPEMEKKSISIDGQAGGINLSKLQEDLLTSNTTMHILLEDQQALTKLLFNTLNLQQTAVSSKLCYGISPDFLIYQLDNCSAQFASILKESKDLQWQLYSLTKGVKNLETDESRLPLSNSASTPGLQDMAYATQSGIDGFPLQIQSPANQQQAASLPFPNYTSEPVIPKKHDPKQDETADSEGDLFEAMRDSIYSEAAILISQNESRPHFLIELFHTLQQLNTDYLRQHALYALQDIIKGYIPTSPRRPNELGKNLGRDADRRTAKRASFSENTPSETAASSEDEVYVNFKTKVADPSCYDYSLKLSGASEVSTPSDDESAPFAADDLGSTVIHLDAALRHMREVERLKQEIKSSENAMASPESSGKTSKSDIPPINTKVLRVWIKNIVSEIIPILKANHDRTVDKKLVKKMHKKVLECVSKDVTGMRAPAGSNQSASNHPDADRIIIGNYFSGQLKSILDDCFSKFIGRRVGSCGEDVIVSLSEVLFNELAFFYMMQDLGQQNIISPATDVPAIKVEEHENPRDNAAESNPSTSDDKDDEKNDDSEVSNAEEAGPVMDKDISMQVASSHGSPDPVIFDLSVSETKPLTSYGSGEDEEDGSGEDYDYKEPEVCTSMQQNTDSTVDEKDVEKEESHRISKNSDEAVYPGDEGGNEV